MGLLEKEGEGQVAEAMMSLSSDGLWSLLGTQELTKMVMG